MYMLLSLIYNIQETEALYALATVEAAAKASDLFAKEIAKFRYLSNFSFD